MQCITRLQKRTVKKIETHNYAHRAAADMFQVITHLSVTNSVYAQKQKKTEECQKLGMHK